MMKGDTSHFSHRLTNLGMSRPQAVATVEGSVTTTLTGTWLRIESKSFWQ